jgi:hypothetical protein
MHTWFECKISYEKLDENGLPKRVTEPYLVDALSFTEAEARIIAEMQPYISGEFSVSTVSRKNIAELFKNPAGDRWYRGKVCFTMVDMDKGKEKKVNSMMYAQASDIKEALNVIETGLKGTLSDYEIVSVTETLIMDVYPYVVKEEEGEV